MLRLLGRLLRLPLIIELVARQQRKRREEYVTRYYKVYFTAGGEHREQVVFFDCKVYDPFEDNQDIERLLNLYLGTTDAHIYTYEGAGHKVVQATGQEGIAS